MPADRRPPDPAPPIPIAQSAQPVVYAVVPVFNRLSDTLASLDCLRRQTYRPIEIIVADGGSSDGTPEVLERTLPGVQVLRTGKGVWWAGAAAAAVDQALRRSTSDDDFVLFLNNDTEFDPRYVSQLVEASRRHDACVSGVVVDREPPGGVLEAGVVLDRTGFTFRHRTELAPDVPFWQGTDVLPGYGLLVPVRMLRAVGNLNARRYPHYLSDYDLTMRLRRAGFRLGVVSAASIKVRATQPAAADRGRLAPPGDRRRAAPEIEDQHHRSAALHRRPCRARGKVAGAGCGRQAGPSPPRIAAGGDRPARQPLSPG